MVCTKLPWWVQFQNIPKWTAPRLTTQRTWAYFDFERSFESAGKEAPKWPDQRGEGGESDAVDLERVHVHRFLQRKTRHPEQPSVIQLSCTRKQVAYLGIDPLLNNASTCHSAPIM